MSFLDGILNSISGGLFGTLTGVGSGILGNYFAKQDAAQNQRYAKELMQYQYDLQQQGINVQNQYNLPSAQMERLRNAGLNPHLVYGSGSVVGNSSSAASASLGKSASLNRSELVRHSIDAALQTQLNMAQVSNMRAQNDNIKAQNKLIEEQVLSERVKRAGQMIANNAASLDYSFNFQTFKERVQLVAKELEQKQWNIDYTAQSISNLKSQANEIQERINNLIATRALTTAQIATELNRPALVAATIRNLKAQTGLSYEQIKLVREKVVGQIIENGNNGILFDYNSVVKESMDDLAEFWNEHPTTHLVGEIVGYVTGTIGQILGGFAEGAKGIKMLK